MFAPDLIELGSPGVSGPDVIDNLVNVDNIGFYRSALANFSLLAFDIHGALDPAGIGNAPGEVDGSDGVEDLRPALGATFAAGAVPEPAAWALMIAGSGLTGAAMRRRRAFVLA